MAKVRKRRRWLWLGVLPALALGGFFGLRALLQPERLSVFLLRQASDATGLELALSEPADIGFWPDLHLELSGLTATVPGETAPVLRAEQVEAVLPWSALRSQTLQLRSLRLHRPAIDVAQFRRWLDERADRGPSQALTLPRLDAALAIDQGRIVGDGWEISGLSLQLPSLRDGRPTTLALAGRLERANKPNLPFDVRIAVTPQQRGDELRLDPLTLSAIDAGQESAWLQLTGSLALRHPQHLGLSLHGTMPQWPTAWSALPLPASPEDEKVHLSFDYAGAPDLQGALTLRVVRGDEALDGVAQLGDVLGWAGDTTASPLPPLRGALNAARLQFGSVELRGVRVRIEDDPVATSTPVGAPDATP